MNKKIEELTAPERQEILDTKIDEKTTIGQAGGVQFMTWVLKLLNNANTYNSTTQELLLLSQNYPGRYITDDQKIEIVFKLKEINLF